MRLRLRPLTLAFALAGLSGQASATDLVQAYDLARGQYAALQMLIEPRCFIRYGLPQQPDTEMAPARMGSRGIR